MSTKVIRKKTLDCCYNAKASHIGSGLSCIDILYVLYNCVINVNKDMVEDPNRDRFILSKGHAAAAYYSVLQFNNFFPEVWLDNYCKRGKQLCGHVTKNVPGVEVSTGSLGHGLPIAAGMGYDSIRSGRNYKVYVLLSDGELNSGANWEALMFIKAKKLFNVIPIIDKNNFQALGKTDEVIPMNSLSDKFKSFGYTVLSINGHCENQILQALEEAKQADENYIIIANTIKGKGISFMEDKLEWHYKSPSDQEYEDAIKELNKNA